MLLTFSAPPAILVILPLTLSLSQKSKLSASFVDSDKTRLALSPYPLPILISSVVSDETRLALSPSPYDSDETTMLPPTPRQTQHKVDVMSRSNALDDGELCLCGLTLGDERSFLCDTQRSAVAVKTYGNYKALACET